jgi:hypothetical protein
MKMEPSMKVRGRTGDHMGEGLSPFPMDLALLMVILYRDAGQGMV